MDNLTEVAIVEYVSSYTEQTSVHTNFAQQLIESDRKKDDAFRIFKDKMNVTEKAIQ